MATVVASVTTFVTTAITWMSSYLGAITAEGNEVLFIFAVAVPLAGFGIGILRRLINVN